ncbi:phosphatidylinositol-glycan biosynthesis class X protein [Impatiens glandulifera]|uniref:phosphatidylinositol-glycan biosynthesis class X protein n=1 Tax=Impatiens glandulifera TaxID=253017 RepID=UPI001FB0CAD4|nr:phosphatidylinositol-glycan biosynthesis class X protein [Impatiens glandulifera]XP_047342691.1 phosphatidylinositol-glycan biosynthesis class X protein [Impatiens glandulifera]
MPNRTSTWNLVIQLTLLAGVGLFTQACSTLNEKYVAAAYFEKHNSLIDSDFKDFILKELPLDNCGIHEDRVNAVVVKLSALERDLIGEGSHRQLSSSIHLDIQLTKQIKQFWEIIVLERLPSGIFADPFELQHLLSRGEFTDLAVFGDTNLELPSVASNRSLVELHIEVDHNVSSNNKLEVSIKLPLHARYAPLVEEDVGFSRIEFNAPDVIIRTKAVKGDSDDRSCFYSLTGSNHELESHTVVAWDVPSGIKSHTSFVSLLTFIAAVVSAFIIVLTSICY